MVALRRNDFGAPFVTVNGNVAPNTNETGSNFFERASL